MSTTLTRPLGVTTLATEWSSDGQLHRFVARLADGSVIDAYRHGWDHLDGTPRQVNVTLYEPTDCSGYGGYDHSTIQFFTDAREGFHGQYGTVYSRRNSDWPTNIAAMQERLEIAIPGLRGCSKVDSLYGTFILPATQFLDLFAISQT